MKDEAQQLEAWLRAQKLSQVDEIPSQGHLEVVALETLADGDRAAVAAEREHLVACAECRFALSDLLAALPPREARAPWWKTVPRPAWGAIGAVAVAAAALLLVARPSPEDPDSAYQVRGRPAERGAQVSLMQTRPGESVGRPLSDGQTVGLDAKLGFRVGVLEGSHRDVTVLGWDGSTVHWYYPEEAGRPAHALPKGRVSERLPFDIDLSRSHQPGPLLVVAAFDVDPLELAKRLESGVTPSGPGITSLRLTMVAP